MNTIIRTIIQADNTAIATIIRTSLTEFGANRPGTVFTDESTDNLYNLFRKEGSVYYVAERDNEILGGGGIFPSNGLPDGVCELVKMYLKKEARGSGLGKELINKCLEYAAATGYQKVYIESMPELRKAVSIYEKFGFTYLNGPMGDTGHYGCEVWMVRLMVNG
ncbi:MAG: GNAT family N-acetyltransferase [Chitinophagaceae bacterium]